MAFIDFLKQNKDKSVKDDDPEYALPLYANRNVAKLFEQQKMRRDSEPSVDTKNQGESIIVCKRNHKRNSKSEENIFEKISECGRKTSDGSVKVNFNNFGDNIKYGTLPKSKLLSTDNDDEDVVDGKSYKNTNRTKTETESNLADYLNNRLKLRKSSDELNPSIKRSNNSLDHQSSSTSSSTEYLDQSDRNKMMSSPPPHVMTDAQGLIVPKKLVNPCLESSDRQNLHRELMFNQKIGKPILNQKSELQRALEKQKERQFAAQQKQEQDHNKANTIENELTKVIMQRAQRLENSQKENKNELDDHFISPEYLNARAKLKHTIDTK